MSRLLSCDLMNLIHGICGVSLVAMLGRDFMKLTCDYIRLIQDHFTAKNIVHVHFCGILLDY